jgi:uncharacterized RDD family membrane protein YckC
VTFRYCPTCGDEYREGYERCADCDVLLVDHLPSPAEAPQRVIGMATGDVSKLSAGQRSLLEYRLRASDVHFEMKGDVLAFPTERAAEVEDLIAALPLDDEMSSSDVRHLTPAGQVTKTLEKLRAPDASPLWRRYLAWTIDSVLLVAALKLAADFRHQPAITFAAFTVYHAVAIAAFGRTIGKAFLRLRVVRFSDGSRPPIRSAVVRAVVAQLALVLPSASASRSVVGGAYLLVSLAMMLTDVFRRGLADRVARTRVVVARSAMG